MNRKSLRHQSFIKFCKKCNEWKSSLEFVKNKASKDGRFHSCKKCWKKYTSNPEVQKRLNDAVKRSQRKHSQEHIARTKLNYALKKGRVKKLNQCAKTGCDEVTTACHHPDYNQPLKFIEYCRYHHEELHHEIENLSHKKSLCQA